MQLALWNNRHLQKKQDYNGFLQINTILFNLSRVNHKSLDIMDVCNKCCEINTVSSTSESLQVLPWNNETIIEKTDAWKWCRHVITNVFSYMHAWNQGGIVIGIYDIFLLQFLLCKNAAVSLKEWVAAITLLQ